MRALFIVNEEKRGLYAGARTYVLNAVTPAAGTPDADDPEVNDFWTATPQGSMSITITNPAAYLELGRKYYLDFTPHAEAAAPGL